MLSDEDILHDLLSTKSKARKIFLRQCRLAIQEFPESYFLSEKARIKKDLKIYRSYKSKEQRVKDEIRILLGFQKRINYILGGKKKEAAPKQQSITPL